MTAALEIPGKPRCPYRFGPVGGIMRLRRYALSTDIRPLRNFSKFMTKVWYRLLGFPLHGTFGLEVDGEVRWIELSTGNSHLETVLAWPLGSYEPTVAALIDAFLPDEGTFFDIGANWGYYSLYAASRPGFAGRVHAFEPYPPTAADLKAVLAQAGFGDGIVAHNIALSDSEGEARMAVPHRVKAAQANIRDYHTGGAVVPTIPLDALDLPDPDFIKLDVEGHEIQVLEGARETLLRARPAVVFENWVLPGNLDETLAPVRFFEELGFRIYAPHFDRDPSGASGRLRLAETSSMTRAEIPQIVDLCAIHPDRMNAETGRSS